MGPHGGFGAFHAYDRGRCTTPGGPEAYQSEQGFYVGWQDQSSVLHAYADAWWYSLPGPCPQLGLDERLQNASCARAFPGGGCPAPNGSATCTYRAEYAGEASLDALEGIDDFASWAAAGGREYVRGLDAGVGMSFWDGIHDPAKCAERVRRAALLFDAAEETSAGPISTLSDGVVP